MATRARDRRERSTGIGAAVKAGRAVVTTVGEKTFGYRLDAELGAGPFGRVFEATDPEGRAVCLKLLKAEFASQPDAAASFERVRAAVRVHAQIDHPYVARALRALADPERGAYAVVSERSPGRPLGRIDVSHAAQDGEQPTELARLLFLFEELGEALHWVHHAGLVHGNLKPSNVVVQRGDFGLVPRLVDLSWSALGVSASAESHYISPEQFAGRVPTAASDQWSYGTVLTRMLTSKRPDRSFGAVPDRLVDALQRCRARELSARFPSMREAVDEVRAVRSALERAANPARRPTRSEAGRAHEPPVPAARSLTLDTGDVEEGEGSTARSSERSRDVERAQDPTLPAVPVRTEAPSAPSSDAPSASPGDAPRAPGGSPAGGARPPPPAATGSAPASRPWDVDVEAHDFKPKTGRWLLMGAAAILVGVGAALWWAPIPEAVEDAGPGPPRGAVEAASEPGGANDPDPGLDSPAESSAGDTASPLGADGAPEAGAAPGGAAPDRP